MADLFDDRACELGEGPIWHPERQRLYWFDILNQRILWRGLNGGVAAGPGAFELPERFSAAGRLDADHLLAASETGLWRLSLIDGHLDRVAQLEADNPATRSNDGRADPWGGFWVGTMGLGAETGAGAIYRHYGGEVRQLFDRVSIPNAISFTPERSHAHFADSKAGKVWRVRLEPADGWPVGEAELFLDYAGRQSAPDGAVCDAASNLWIAEWGAGRVAGYGKDGREIGHVAVAGRHSSCPAFGGPDLTTLFVTTAREHMTEADIAAEPRNGCVFRTEGAGRGLPEPVVVL